MMSFAGSRLSNVHFHGLTTYRSWRSAGAQTSPHAITTLGPLMVPCTTNPRHNSISLRDLSVFSTTCTHDGVLQQSPLGAHWHLCTLTLVYIDILTCNPHHNYPGMFLCFLWKCTHVITLTTARYIKGSARTSDRVLCAVTGPWRWR